MLSRLSSFSGPLSKLFTAIKGFTLNGLILRYEISDNDSYSGSNTVTDLVGNSNATLVDGPTYSVNGYLNFDGVNDYLYTNSNLQSSFSGVSPNKSELTSIFMWIYPTDDGVILSEIGVQNTFVGVWHTSIVEMVSGSFKFGLWSDGSGNINVTSSIPTPLNNWYYIGMTYNGSTLTAYVDGVSVGTVTFNRLAPYNSGSGLFYSLAHSDTTNMGSDGSYVKMKLGAFQVYNTALSQQQILNNYNFTKSNYIYTEDMLIWIDANDPESFSGGTVFDISGNNYHHSLTSGATLSTIFGFKSFDCSTGNKRIEVNGTGPTLPTTGYTYVSWARIISSSASFRTLLYTKGTTKITPITIPNASNALGYWATGFVSSGYDLSSLGDVWVQYSVVGDNSSQTFYINGSQVGSTINQGAGGNTHWGLGNNDIVPQSFGYVGNMMFYNKKLTLDQIKQNFNALKHVYKNLEIFTTVETTTWTAPIGVTTVEYLVVAGGGGAGNGFDNAGGGGGAGGMVLTGTINVTSGQSYTITVGDGGIGGANARVNNAGTDGENSVFGSIIALGGGRGQGSRTGGLPGAKYTDVSAATGGAGSGGGNGGKGGGGVINGFNNSGTTGGAGGNGVSSSISGTSVTYGAGGAGGNAGTQNSGVNGTSNSGNGGRAGGAAAASSTGGGNGGSGIVIIKYY
jgi:hypothetical protein